MKIIQQISDMISEEIADAKKYAMCAMRHKDDHPDLAELFYRLAGEELTHMSMLHDKVVVIISDYRKQNGEPPESMMAVYNYLHGKQIEQAAEVKTLRAMFKE